MLSNSTTPCVMLFNASSSRRPLSSSRRSAKALTRLMPNIATAMLAMASASEVGDSDISGSARVGSGTTSPAAMAVK